jgi:hypothetical protein
MAQPHLEHLFKFVFTTKTRSLRSPCIFYKHLIIDIIVENLINLLLSSFPWEIEMYHVRAYGKLITSN